MIFVIKISEQVARQIAEIDYDGMGSLFYPIQDVDNNWIISQQECENCIYQDIKNLIGQDLIPFNPKQVKF